MLGPRFHARALSSCSKRGPLFIAVRGPLTVAASLVAEHRLQTLRLSSCGSRAQLLRGMWDPPRPGLEPVSPTSAGRLPTTAPPGKPWYLLFLCMMFSSITICWNDHPFPTELPLQLCWKSFVQIIMGLFLYSQYFPLIYLSIFTPNHTVLITVAL